MLNTGSAAIIFLAIVLSLVPHDMMYGPQAALIAESFTGRLRYSGSSLGYQLASVIAGGPAPLIATWLFGTYQTSYAIAIYIGICAVISLIATAFMTDYTGKDIGASTHSDGCQVRRARSTSSCSTRGLGVGRSNLPRQSITVHHRRSVAPCNPRVSYQLPRRYMSDQIGRFSIANSGRAPWRNVTPIKIVRFRTVYTHSSTWRS
jgi:hypothetical protein